MISTKDSKGKEIGEKLSFKNSKQMAEKLKVLATEKVEEFTIVDIHMQFLCYRYIHLEIPLIYY